MANLSAASLHFAAFLSFAYCILANLAFGGGGGKDGGGGIIGGISQEDLDSHPHLGLDKFGGPWKYLTFWNLWFQAVYFLICFVNDLRGRIPSSKLVRAEDYIYCTVAFPIGMFVGIIFWTLYAIDRELVFPAIMDKYVPPHLNHLMHTTVIPLQLRELLFVRHEYPRPPSRGARGTVAICFVYCAWIQLVATVGDFWIYPIFNVLTPQWRYAFMFGCSCFGSVLYFLGAAANKARWGIEDETDDSPNSRAAAGKLRGQQNKENKEAKKGKKKKYY